MLSKTLKELRKRKDITQAELARILGITQQAVARWERNKSTPDIGTLEQLANYFNVSTDYLLGWVPRKEEIYNEDEIKIMREYRELNELNRRQISNMISAFLVQQAAV